MALTEEQLAFWNDLWPEEPTDEGTSQHTPQQAEIFEVLAVQYALRLYQFEGLDVPSEADVRAELRKKRDGERQDEQNK